MLKKTIGMGGFTLAEVLITLGIIGVVAAMTMPTLINSTQGAQYKTAYKKALSVLSQAVVMNIALEDYDLSQTLAGTNAKDHPTETQTLYTLFKNRMNVVKVAEPDDFNGDNAVAGDADYYMVVDSGDTADRPASGGGTGGDDDDDDDTTASHFITENGGATALGAWPDASTTPAEFGENVTYLFMNDGITFIFDNRQNECAAATATTSDQYCFGFIDVNGQKGPNRVVKCDNGTITGTGDDSSCVVTNPTDIYPVMFYDQSIVPASAAGRAVLYAK